MITLRRLAVAQYKGLQAIDLALPEKGSFLIEGRNEAGKSTLFDAAFFALYGVPLVGDIASAIHYGAEELEVRLGLDVGGTSLDVRRRARQTAKSLRSEAELVVRRGDDEELVKGSSPVTQRLQQELGGLTNEALLNSCLVAQKQLGKLEGLGRSDREQVLTILLNLGKLFDVERKLKPRQEDDLELRNARMRLTLARAAEELAAVEGRRRELLRVRQLLDLRDSVTRLEALQQQIDAARAAAQQHEAELAAVRARLARAAQVTAAAGAWRRVVDLARTAAGAEEAVTAAERALGEAQQAAAALPAARKRAERYRHARHQAQTLAERQGQRQALATRIERVQQRLAEREQIAMRAARLEGELEGLRRQRRGLKVEIEKLAPIAGQLQQTQAHLAGLQTLARHLEVVETNRRALEDLEARAAERAEAEARFNAAAVGVAEARTAFEAEGRQRSAHQERQRQAQLRGLLGTWIERRAALDAAERAKRLMDDLALAVAGVEHVAATADGTDAPGLVLELVLDHPLTGAQVVALEVSAGGAWLREVRPATTNEAKGLKAGGLPTLNAAGDARERAQLQEAQRAFAAAGERAPKTPDEAERRLAEVLPALRTPATTFDEAAYVAAAGALSTAEGRLKDAREALAGLPGVEALARESARGREGLAALERECRVAAQQLGLPTADTTELSAAIHLAATAAQQRSNELASAAGRREGLEGQLASLDQSGIERARELEESRQNLAQDDEATLRTTVQTLEAEARGLEAEIVRLCDALRAALGGKDAAGGDDAADLSEAAVAALREEAQRLADEAGQAVAVLEEKAGAAEALAGDLRGAQEALAGRRAELTGALAELVAEDCQVVPGEVAQVATCRLEALSAELEGLDEPGARAVEQEAQRAAGMAERDVQHSLDDAAMVTRTTVALAQALGHPVAGAAELNDEPALVAAQVLTACAEVSGDLPPREETEAQLRALEQQVGRLEQARQDAVATLGKDEPVDVAAAQAAVEEIERDLAARRCAVDMVVATRRRMIDKVLPETIHNMCLLLPELTAGRYRYANLTADYRLQVWDERKRDYVEKSLLSGGTQDQFSLALRLGFALAALPRELGTSPGFLFLDEPLSSFDRDRTTALVDLLTHGQIATFFQQVFLISHSQSFDPGLFTHHIVMEEGRVAQSTLSAPPAA